MGNYVLDIQYMDCKKFPDTDCQGSLVHFYWTRLLGHTVFRYLWTDKKNLNSFTQKSWIRSDSN